MACKYANIRDGLMEAVQNLKLAQNVQKDNVLILRDFSVYVGAHWGVILL